MPNKMNRKSKALKDKTQNSFLRALLFGFFSCAVTWICLALVLAFILSLQSDGGALTDMLSPVIVILSLLLGGFVSGKIDKSNAYLTAFILGCSFLGISYALSTAFNITKSLGPAIKTAIIALMILCPVLGAKIATQKKKARTHRK